MPERLRVAAYLLTEAARVADPHLLPRRLATALCEGMHAEGAAVTLMPHTTEAQLLCASDDVALRLEEVQFEVGHGPGTACAASGKPVVIGDCRRVHPLWPVFSVVVGEHLPQVQALWSFPVLRGSDVLGAITLHRTCPWPAHHKVIQQGVFAAWAVARLLEDLETVLLEEEDETVWEPRDVVDSHWLHAHRAAGMLAEHLGTTAAHALLLMRARSFGTGTPLPLIAADIARNPLSWTDS
ncbi:GAF domain-containing protein [Streptomyces sp. NPDC004111]|uniref:GAF domain-containing protein n=1 Tax=Streptomyces sp. NPDC004111 TaxID=3364690 RepID=UPI00369CBDA2